MIIPTEKPKSSESSQARKKVTLLGSTGSVGRSALEVIRKFPDKFEVFAITARRNVELLAKQIREFRPRYAVLAESELLPELKEKISGCTTKVLDGDSEIAHIAAHPEGDTVVAAIVGFAGLRPVVSAIKAGKTVALANKESLVTAGDLINKILSDSSSQIIPVDSEHSALFQALQGESLENLRNLILVASGGPFYKTPVEKLKNVRPADAIKHPNWSMGAKISVDSATMVNKALELIEAYWLFGVNPEQIEVIVHPQSIIHSLVDFNDGTQIAQLAVPDMKGPIAYALNYPFGRLTGIMEPLDLRKLGNLEFFALDNQRFPAVKLARECLKQEGIYPAVFNSANEAAVDLFLNQQISFTDIVKLIEMELEESTGGTYETLEDLTLLDAETRRRTVSRASVLH